MLKKIFFQPIIVLLCLILLACQQDHETLEDVNGNKLVLSRIKGNWLLIHYWASWCHSCKKEIPEFNAFYEQSKNQNVKMFAVNYEDLPVLKQKQLIEQFNIKFPSLKNDPRDKFYLPGITVLPVTFILDPSGKLKYTLYGPQSRAKLAFYVASN